MPVETLERPQEFVHRPTENEGERVLAPPERPRAAILEHIEALTPIIRNNENIVLTAGTGAGKSTFFIQSLWHDILGEDSRIAITLPRRENVKNNSLFTSQLIGDERRVGFKYKGANKNPEANIIYYVEGSFLNKIKEDPLMLEFDAIVPDEIHEQGDTTAIVLAKAKESQKERLIKNLKPLKIIPTSATMDAEKVKRYLGEGTVWYDVPGEKLRFERTQLFEPEGVNITSKDMPVHCAKKILEIIGTGDTSAILNFLPGKAQIKEVNKLLKESIYKDRLEIIEVHSKMTSEEKEKLADKSKRDPNKIFISLSTTLAETGITIDGLGHVVDSGLITQKELDKATGIEYLKQVEHSKSGILQREGRVGRVAAGTIHHMYSKSNYERRPMYQVAGLQRSNLLSFVLNLKNLGYKTYDDFDFLDAPERKQWKRSENNLIALGALDSSGNMTPKGEEMLNMPVDDLNIAGMLYEAKANGSMNNAVTLAAFLTNESKMPFVHGNDRKMKIPPKYYDSRSDYLAFLKAFNDYKTGVKDEHVDQQTMKKIDDLRTQIASDLKYREAFSPTLHEEAVQKAFVFGYIDKLLHYDSTAKNYKIRSGSVELDKNSLLNESEIPYIISGSFTQSSRDGKLYAQLGQEVPKEWINNNILELLKDTTDQPSREIHMPSSEHVQQHQEVHATLPHVEEHNEVEKHDEHHDVHEEPKKKENIITRFFNKIKSMFSGKKDKHNEEHGGGEEVHH